MQASPADIQVVPELWSGEDCHGRVSAVAGPLQEVPHLPPPFQAERCEGAGALAAPTGASLAEEGGDALLLMLSPAGTAAAVVAFEVLLHSLQATLVLCLLMRLYDSLPGMSLVCPMTKQGLPVVRTFNIQYSVVKGPIPMSAALCRTLHAGEL